MKTYIIIILSLFCSYVTSAQTYYVNGEIDATQPIMDKLISLNQKVTTIKDSANFVIDCTNIITLKNNPYIANGYIIIVNKSGMIVSKSDNIKAAVSQVSGKDPITRASQKIADEYLSDMLLKLKK